MYIQPLYTCGQAAELLEDHCGDEDPDALPPLTTPETAKLAGWFCLLWFIANWALAVALRYTTVASATILSSMSGMSLVAAPLPNKR
jgi:solute carrier family 35, member F5